MEIKKFESKKGYVNKYPPIHPENDEEMVAVGLRQPKYISHPEVHIKTMYEKEELKKLRSNCKPISKYWFVPKPHDIVKGRLTIYYKNVKKDKLFRTTETIMCFKDEVQDILTEKTEEHRLTINKYYFKY